MANFGEDGGDGRDEGDLNQNLLNLLLIPHFSPLKIKLSLLFK
ncbi:hypothetical protein Cri9333_1402 [Crinalium epipsammum PCC 9333]|uniref:Uncharacterized protein n=1 Tax=Crinalium epipsammum PCC 9333 TaxID=1173022 RepID=K9VWE5_9CYAN|nr:hypothetical protein Cri9333_1402 [Crinalium epipsammum PCC 9333]